MSFGLLIASLLNFNYTIPARFHLNSGLKNCCSASLRGALCPTSFVLFGLRKRNNNRFECIFGFVYIVCAIHHMGAVVEMVSIRHRVCVFTLVKVSWFSNQLIKLLRHAHRNFSSSSSTQSCIHPGCALLILLPFTSLAVPLNSPFFCPINLLKDVRSSTLSRNLMMTAINVVAVLVTIRNAVIAFYDKSQKRAW